MMLIVGSLYLIPAALSLGIRNPFNGLTTAAALTISLVAGSGLGGLSGRRMVTSLKEKGVFRPSRKDLFLLGLAIILVAAGVWLIFDAGIVFSPLATLGGYSFLTAAWTTQAVSVWRWEKTSGKKVEYDGLWSIKAQPWP
jgi:hypothetical protein